MQQISAPCNIRRLADKKKGRPFRAALGLSELVTNAGLLRIGELQQLLAEVRAGEEPDDGLGSILEPVLEIDLVFDLAVGVPLRQFRDRLRIFLREVEDQES